tara:strand:+ start:2614 stop:2988 length:375 start_codon:yes stop_codon:yes gene_type:complete
MIKLVQLPIHLLLFLSLMGSSFMTSRDFDANKHLIAYSQVNQTQHDNIDDTQTPHSHRHKHTSDGEEHEHNHDHSKLSHQETKLISQPEILMALSYEYHCLTNFTEPLFFSNSYPLKLFRPPIS